MTVVFYRGLSRLVGSEQVALKSALADKAHSKDVRKTCLERALTVCLSATSCAGHVMGESWKDESSWPESAQASIIEGFAAISGQPSSYAGHVLDLLTWKSTVPPASVRSPQQIGGSE